MLFENNNPEQLNNIPHHTLIIYYGIIAYQIFLPFSEKNKNLPMQKNIILPIQEHLITDKYENDIPQGIEVDHVRLISLEKTIAGREKFSMRFREK